jgi:predicted TIM-barrel fold metal-dependent hydrolase
MPRDRSPEPDAPPPLPFEPGPVTNGEYVPEPSTPRDRWIAHETLARVAEAADRLHVDRRRLLQSAGGMAAMLGVVNLVACSGDDSAARTARTTTTAGRPTTTTTGPGGTYTTPTTEDAAACETALGSQGEFVFDVHTHHVMPDGPWRTNAPRIVDMVRDLVPDGCMEADALDCLDRGSYLHDLFLASDTTIALLSDVPNSGPQDAPVPFDDAVGTKALADTLTTAGASRVLLHNVIAPNFGDLSMRLDDMTARVETRKVAAFKVYTAWGPNHVGFAMDDPAIGIPVIEHARALGVKVFCAHKGLPLLEFDRHQNGPRDMCAIAKRYPDMQFVVYHGAFQRDKVEAQYDPGDAATGVNSLVQAMDEFDIAPNTNVWAETGTAWRELMTKPTQAAHLWGKLLTRVGEDRVLWGTDSIWLGSPQPQIMAFRAFQITPEFQQRFGYPALTPAIKQKVFGLNAAKLFGIDAAATRCGLDADGLAAARAEARTAVFDRGITPWSARGPVTRRDFLTWLGQPGTRWSPA